MKKRTITLALLAVLSLANTGCQKEESLIPTDINSSQPDARYNLYYSVDGTSGHRAFATEEERRAFLLQLTALAQEGHTVRISANPLRTCMSKEKVTFVTTNKDEALSWMYEMLLDGYEVYYTYDEGTGEFTCVAIK